MHRVIKILFWASIYLILSFGICLSTSLTPIQSCNDDEVQILNWFIGAYNNGVALSDLKIPYESHEVELLFFLFPELTLKEKMKIEKHLRQNDAYSLFFAMAREYSIFWDRGAILRSGCIKQLSTGRV